MKTILVFVVELYYTFLLYFYQFDRPIVKQQGSLYKGEYRLHLPIGPNHSIPSLNGNTDLLNSKFAYYVHFSSSVKSVGFVKFYSSNKPRSCTQSLKRITANFIHIALYILQHCVLFIDYSKTSHRQTHNGLRFRLLDAIVYYYR